MTPRSLFWLLAVLILGAAAPAAAEDCKSLQWVTSAPLSGDRMRTLPVLVNGEPKTFLLDTGGLITQISPDTAAAMKLRIRQGNVRLLDVNGDARDKEVTLDSFQIGNMQIRDDPMPVSSFNFGEGINGLLSLDYFYRYDVDLDFGSNRINFFSTDHCLGKILYWSADTVAIIPADFQDGHITIPVTVAGKQLKAIVDTGASSSTMDLGTAQRMFGIVPQAGDGQANINGDPDLKATYHLLPGLSLEGITIQNLKVLLLPDIMGSKDPQNTAVTGMPAARLDDAMPPFQMIIGMDVLQHLHVYIDYRERKLFITPADTKAAARLPPLPGPTPAPP